MTTTKSRSALSNRSSGRFLTKVSAPMRSAPAEIEMHTYAAHGCHACAGSLAHGSRATSSMTSTSCEPRTCRENERASGISTPLGYGEPLPAVTTNVPSCTMPTWHASISSVCVANSSVSAMRSALDDSRAARSATARNRSRCNASRCMACRASVTSRENAYIPATVPLEAIGIASTLIVRRPPSLRTSSISNCDGFPSSAERSAARTTGTCSCAAMRASRPTSSLSR